MNQTTIGSYIAQKRRAKNLTQEQLAEKLGGRTRPSPRGRTGFPSIKDTSTTTQAHAYETLC